MAKNAKKADKNQNSEKQDAKKTKNDNQEEGIVLDAKNLLVLGLIAVLLIAGIGFLIFGLVQSAQNQGEGDNGRVETSENGGESDEEGQEDDQASENGEEGEDGEGADEEGSEGENGEDTADGDTDSGESEDESGDADSDTSEEDSEEVNAAEVSGKYKQTSTRYSRGNDYECGDIRGETYKIVKGDTLWQIAEGRYCSGYAWVELYNANKSLIKNPDLIYPGWEIKMYKLNMI